MNHDTIKFQKRLDRFRTLTDKRRNVACEIMGISHSTYGRLRATLRAEANEVTPMQRFAINLANVRKFLGDRYPTSVMPAEIARAGGITANQAARARDVLVRERIAAERDAAPSQPSRREMVPAGKRRVRLVVTDDNQFYFVEARACN